MVGVSRLQVIVTATTRSERRNPVVTPWSIFSLFSVVQPLAGSTLQKTLSPTHSATTRPPGVDCAVAPEAEGVDEAEVGEVVPAVEGDVDCWPLVWPPPEVGALVLLPPFCQLPGWLWPPTAEPPVDGAPPQRLPRLLWPPVADAAGPLGVGEAEDEERPDLVTPGLWVALADPDAECARGATVDRPAASGGASREVPINRDPVTAYPADWVASHETPATPPTAANHAATAPMTARRARRPGRRPDRVLIVADSQVEG
jgi:hypothetical protein